MLKILIVEDNLIFAKDLAKGVQQYNCEVVGIAASAEKAIELFETKEPNLVFIDLELEGEKDGIYVAEHINKTCRVPFIFLTDNFGSSNKFFKKATNTLPANYLPKGTFLPNQLWHFVEAAMSNYSKAGGLLINEDEPSAFIRNQFFVKSKGVWEKLTAEDITHITVNKPYCEIHTTKSLKKYLVRKPLDFTVLQFNSVKLIRIHQSHAVNINFISKYDYTKSKVILSTKNELEVGRTFKKLLPKQVLFLD
jgi:DNA-binding LytR/AlgR family response regulator